MTSGRRTPTPILYHPRTEAHILMKTVIGALVALLLGTVFISTDAEARCWWNGYNHCRYYHHGWYHHGWYHGYWYR